MTRILRYLRFAGLAGLATLCACSPAPRSRRVLADNAGPAGDKMTAEAFLFSARVTRNGKPTTVRLELYVADTVTALAGKGYLGRGALQGLMTRDSITAYFPSSGEYFRDAASAALGGSSCLRDAPQLDLPALLRQLPEIANLGPEATVTAFNDNAKRPRYELSWPGCDWRLELTYDLRKTGWRLKEFVFDGGEEMRVKAARREYKAAAKIKRRKFELSIPEGATRISP